MATVILNRHSSSASTAASKKRQVWSESASGDFSLAGNWTTAAPVDTDVVVFNKGDVSVTSGLNQSSVHLARLLIGGEYSGDVGSSASPLQIDSDKLVIRRRVGGTYLKGSFRTVYIDVNAIDVELDTPSGGTIAELHISQATKPVEVMPRSSLGRLFIDAEPGRMARANIGLEVDILGGVGSVEGPALVHVGGSSSVSSETGAQSAVVAGGRLYTSESAALASVEVFDRGQLLHASSATIASVTIWSGRVTLEDVTGASVTISAATVHAGGELDTRTGLHSATISAATTYGGLVRVDPGRTIAP